MKIKFLLSAFILLIAISISCENNELIVSSGLNEDLATLIEDEVISDINFADILDEGDDGVFWGEDDDLSLKSAVIEQAICFNKQVAVEENKKTITFEYTGECAREGTVIIEIYRPDENGVKKKTVTYIDFKKHGITYNGFRQIEKGNGIFHILAEMEIDRLNRDGDSINIVRNYEREVEWLCGLETRDTVEDNIKQVTGEAEVIKTVNGEQQTYSRKILEPLLIVRACDLRIQAGIVEIKKVDGTVITLNYGSMPDEIICDADFDCDNSFVVTKGYESINMVFVNGEHVEVSSSEE